jgi:hypothetical protein
VTLAGNKSTLLKRQGKKVEYTDMADDDYIMMM